MRTINPSSIKTDFIGAIADVRTTRAATATRSIPAKSRNLISEYSFLSAAILLEGYVSDLFIAYINCDGTQFTAHLTSKMTIETKDEHAKRALAIAAIKLNKHVTATEIEQIIDDKGYNVTFPETGKMMGAANLWLASVYAIRFTSLSAPQKASLEAIRGMRNFLAHRSKSSKDKMQAVLAETNLGIDLRRGAHEIRDVGSFLESKPTPLSKARIELYLDEIVAIAGIFCP